MKYRSLSAAVATIAFLGLTAPAHAAITLGSAGDFAVLAGTSVTNTGPTVLTGGHVGAGPGGTVTGFPPGTVLPPFTMHIGDPTAQQALTDLASAYSTAAATSFTQDLTGTDLGGQILTPGVYHFATSAALTGVLTLDYGGNPNAEFIFQIGTTLTTAAASSVISLNSGLTPPSTPGSSVFWQVGTSATLGTGTVFEGHLLALTSITLGSGTTLTFGSALAQNGSVVLDTNQITNAVSVVPEPSALTLGLLSISTVTLLRRQVRRR